jgi:hypothetical protein
MERAVTLGRILALGILLGGGCSGPAGAPGGASFRIATFSADITPPVGHALCGGMVPPAARISDPLSGRGIILWGGGEPVVIAALDWTELRNDAYDRWRSELAKAAGTSPQRVLLSCVHQHDAPFADLEAQRLLDAQGLKGFHVDPEFHERAVQAVASAVREAARSPRRITHLGMGQAEVDRVASNRRVVVDGRVTFKRYSKTADPAIKDAPEGLIDPWLKALSFWDGDRVIAVLSAYAVHPMSFYGGGAVSADFPGLARARREQCMPGVFWMYLSGCSGDVTAAKYNNADAASRRALADRLHLAMTHAWQKTRRVPLEKIGMRVEELRFDVPQPAAALEKTLGDPAASKSARLMAALGLSWAKRVARGQPIEVAAVDFGPAQYLLLPAEAFVEFQLAAQRQRPDQFILVAGYGECGPGYIPTESARTEGYVEEHGYTWVAAGAEEKLKRAVAEALK